MIDGLSGTVSKIGVTVSRKLTDGNYGSFEVAYYIEASMADAQTDIDEQFEILDTYLTNKVGKSAHDKEAKIGTAPVEPKPKQTTPNVTQRAGMLADVPEDWCPIHNCQMDKRPKDWKPGQEYWFSHSTGKGPDGKYQYCRGKA